MTPNRTPLLRASHRRQLSALVALPVAISLAVSPAFAQGTAPVSTPTAPPAAVPAAAVPPAALGDSLTGDAKAEYEAGKLLYGDGDFAAATVKFQRAYDLSHDARLLWNIAVCQKQLRRYAVVSRLVQEYLDKAGPALSDADRQEATNLAAAVKAFVSNLRVNVSEPGAAVQIDDDAVGTSPLTAPILVELGARRVRVTKPGFKEYATTLNVEGATEQLLDVKLTPDLHQGRVTVTVSPSGAISIDGKVVGDSRWEGALASGGHTLRVTAPGMRTYQSEVTLRDDETRTLQVTLEQDTKPGSGVPTWVWIGGGVLLAGAAATGGFLLFKPKDEGAPPAVPGTMPPGQVQLPLIGGWR